MFEQLFKCSILIQEMILMNSVYMDNNATTSLKKEVLNAMMPYYTDIYGNASSKFYKIGRDAEQALYKLRESVAKSLNAKNVNEIYFTGSGCDKRYCTCKQVKGQPHYNKQNRTSRNFKHLRIS